MPARPAAANTMSRTTNFSLHLQLEDLWKENWSRKSNLKRTTQKFKMMGGNSTRVSTHLQEYRAEIKPFDFTQPVSGLSPLPLSEGL